MAIAVKVEGLGKRFLLGQTFESTRSSRVSDLLRDIQFEIKAVA
ncbi:hypothetical protein [Thermomonas sp.]|nr:hypothetical protein [Thermomonas sp.]MDI1253521.1 hypothetical protein [Thermomonas sp.]